MADAITAAIGAIIMIGYIWLIASKLDAWPLWVAAIIGLVPDAVGLLARRLEAGARARFK